MATGCRCHGESSRRAGEPRVSGASADVGLLWRSLTLGRGRGSALGQTEVAEDGVSARPFERDDAPSSTALLIGVFRDRNRRLAIGGAVLTLVLFIAAVLSGVRFQAASDVGIRLYWGLAMLLCVGLVMAVKIWYWLEMSRLALTRELKRLELRVAGIADRLDAQRPG